MQTEVSPQEAKIIVANNIRAGIVTMLKGSPSTAKSSIIKEIAQDYNLKLIDLRLAQCDPTDLLGFPYIDQTTNRARYVPMETFPLAGDPLPVDSDGNPMEGWLLFLDEFNSADRPTQKGAYKLVLDFMVGNQPLHPRVAIVAAGNLETDGALVETMSTALRSRLAHLTVRPDPKSWLKYAEKVGFDHRITSFIKFKPDCLYTFQPENPEAQETYACYRTWEFTDRVLKKQSDLSDPTLTAQLAGILSMGVAREFMAFLKCFDNLPTLTEILANPGGVTVPTSPGTLYALSGSLGQKLDVGNADKLINYIQRMPADFQIVTLRAALRREVKLLEVPALQRWVSVNGKDLQE